MGIPHRIADTMFHAAVGTLDGVAVIGHRFAGDFVDQFEFVAEVHWHRQQAAERGWYEGVANNDRAGSTHNHVAVATGTALSSGIQPIDEHRSTDGTGDRAPACGFIGHTSGGKAIEVHIRGAAGNRIRTMSWKRTIGGICYSGSRFATHGKFLFKVSNGVIGVDGRVGKAPALIHRVEQCSVVFAHGTAGQQRLPGDFDAVVRGLRGIVIKLVEPGVVIGHTNAAVGIEQYLGDFFAPMDKASDSRDQSGHK